MNFDEIISRSPEKVEELKIDILYDILNSQKLRNETEDEHLKMINRLYSKNKMYSIFYETVYFENVSTNIMKEFISTFDMNELIGNIWTKLSKRLCCEITNIQNDKDDNDQNRYKEKPKNGTTFSIAEGQEFKGILNYFQKKTTATLLVK